MRPQAAATGCHRRRYRLLPQVTFVVAVPCRCLFEVILKPDPGNSQDLFICSLSALGKYMVMLTVQFSFLIEETVYHTLKGIIKAKYGQDACNVGDEGVSVPTFRITERDWFCSLMQLKRLVTQASFAYIICGIKTTMQIKIGMDVAASEFFTKDGKYDLNFKKQPNDGAHMLIAQSLCELYKDFVFS
ncbi:hypothetical protein L1049_019805 [Liquidambar formosana]|uniref:phosphopyruvate hydratase n=1 Tax=Liquidambar formosana TaxID=63359 RepID=A0AAP0S6E7_LIQFO